MVLISKIIQHIKNNSTIIYLIISLLCMVVISNIHYDTRIFMLLTINNFCLVRSGYIMSRTHKKDYTKSKKFDRSCRNHGSCSWCIENRTHFDRIVREKAEEEIKDYEQNNKKDC